MSICAWCKEKPCSQMKGEYPSYCPINNDEWQTKVVAEYSKDENRRIAAVAANIEKAGYCEWTRLQEISEFAKASGFSKIGLAFCIGLREEARVVADYYKHCGFEIVSAVCCTGAIDKSVAGIAEDDKFRPNHPESMCNPIGQAMLMNDEGTEFNVVLGLCVGHDSLFFRYSEAPVTVLAAKDRVLGHNPIAAVYCANSYYKKKLFGSKDL